MENEKIHTPEEEDLQKEAQLFKEEFNTSDENTKSTLVLDQLKHENRNIRYFCVNNLTTVAELLGPVRTEEELLSFILDYIINFEDNEEILANLSFKLFELINYITNRNNISSILRGLELLAANDDELVRQSATDNLCKLISMSDDKIIQIEIFPLMQRLMLNDIKSKISCCYLFPLVYQKLTCETTKSELFQVFNEIGREDSPSVRRAAAANIGDLALAGDYNLLNNIIKLHANLLKDTVDIVKVHAIESTKCLLEQSDEEQKKLIINNFISSINKDKSWRVKYAAAETISEIVKLFDYNFNELNFLPSIMLFLKDIEPEVRSSAVSKIGLFIKYINKEKFVTSIIPLLQDMINDANHHVRSLLASSLMQISEVINDDKIFENNIFDLINKIAKDETLEVKNSVVSGLEKICGYLKNKNIADKLINPMINEMSKDTKWRVRHTLCDKLKCICDIIDVEIFKKNFMNILVLFFMDHAHEIRKLTIDIFNKILEKDLNESKLLIWEKIKSSLLSNNYILRIEGLKAINFLKEHFYKASKNSVSSGFMSSGNNDNFLKSEIIPFIILLKEDKVPNVRFNIAQTMKTILVYLKEKELRTLNTEIENKIIALITSYSDDSDQDVKYFAEEALNIIKSIKN